MVGKKNLDHSHIVTLNTLTLTLGVSISAIFRHLFLQILLLPRESEVLFGEILYLLNMYTIHGRSIYDTPDHINCFWMTRICFVIIIIIVITIIAIVISSFWLMLSTLFWRIVLSRCTELVLLETGLPAGSSNIWGELARPDYKSVH